MSRIAAWIGRQYINWTVAKFSFFLGCVVGMVVQAFWLVTALTAMGKL